MAYAYLIEGLNADKVADIDRLLLGITEIPAEDVAASNQAALSLLSGGVR